MMEEATSDAHDDSEQRMGWCTMFDEHVELPFETMVLGVEVTVRAIEERENRVVAICTRGRARQAIDLVDLPLPTPPPPGAEWILAYRLWAGDR